MPELVNWTPFPNFRYYSTDNAGAEFGVIIVKATFSIAEDGALTVAEEQAPMVFTDKCHGAVNESSLWHPSDLVPRKAATDIIVNAVAHAPEGKPMACWLCGVQVEMAGRSVQKVVRVNGPRQWVPRWKRPLTGDEKKHWRDHRSLFEKWELSEPEPIMRLPVRYEYAFGDLRRCGTDRNGKPLYDDHGHNPIGMGWLHPEWSDHTISHPALQIEHSREPITDPFKHYAPQGLGPIPPAWEPRLPFGGTYDKNWLDNIWPAWPPDYQFRYHNSAQPDLIMPDYLQGGELIVLAGMRPKKRLQDISLPKERPAVVFTDDYGKKTHAKMQLDTVFLDVAEDRLEDCRVYVSWRVNFEPNLYEQATIIGEGARLPSAVEQNQNGKAGTQL